MQFSRLVSHVRSALTIAALLIVTAHSGAALPSGVSFLSDFGADSVRGKWAHIQVMSLTRLSGSSEKTHHGMPAAVVDVKAGDNPMSCCVGSERAEVLHMRGESGAIIYETVDSGTQYFAVSYKFPTNFRTIPAGTPGQWQIVLQLHGPDALAAPPAFALDVAGSSFKVRLNAGDLVHGTRFVRQDFFDSSLNLGYWTDLIIRIKFATDHSGRVTIWRRNESESRFREVLDIQDIPTLQYNSGRKIAPGKHYWKQGLYRSTLPYRNTFWIGPTARASSFAAAEAAAFNTQSGMPK